MKIRLSNNYLWTLAAITVADVAILFIRNAAVGDQYYNFLLWNLFLGLTPLIITLILHYFSGRIGKAGTITGACVWLLFYPNAPYMVSDLIHVSEISGVVLYDTMIIFLFAMLSLFYGFFSIKILQVLFKGICSQSVGRILLAGAIILSSFGFYLGRILRLNSWDLFTHPMTVMGDIFDHLFPVTKNPVTYVVVILFSFIQFSLLACMKQLEAPDNTVIKT